MRIACVGGGPGGLFLAILLGRTGHHSVDVFDRSAADATYGFGVVFSRLSIARLRARSPEVVDSILKRTVRWQSVEVRYRGASATSHGHGFGAIQRLALLNILRTHAASAGVRLFQSCAVSCIDQFDHYDVVVAADGAGSTIRASMAEHFQPTISYGRTRYIWFGVNRAFPAMTFLLVQGADGLMAAHVYPYSNTASTFLVETTEDVCHAAGFSADGPWPAGHTDTRALSYCQEIFARDLDGGVLAGNGSHWRTFGEVRNQHWSAQRVVLLGDAAHTAHFSIGAGTSLAMEDAAVLASSLDKYPRIDEALHAYQAIREPAVSGAQLAAWASSQFWERLQNESNREVGELLLRLLTRTGQSDLDLLLRTDPTLPATVRGMLPTRPDGEILPLAPFEHAASSRPAALLIQPEQIPSIGLRGVETSRWASVAVAVDLRKQSLSATDRVPNDLNELRKHYHAIPVGIHFWTSASVLPQRVSACLVNYAARLASHAGPDFISIGCSGSASAVRPMQMSLCDLVKSELQLPTIYACAPVDISYGWTHVKAARADAIWRMEGRLE